MVELCCYTIFGVPTKKRKKRKYKKKIKKLFEENQKIYKWEEDTRMPRK
jgi:hypothetical protein